MEQPVTFPSDGLTLTGKLSVPAGGAARKAAIIVMHGFGGHHDGPQQRWSVKSYNDLGYATLRFDFRGCGASEGVRGRVIPYEQVADARAAVDYLASRDDIDPKRIALSGTSYGAAVAVYAAGTDPRVAGVIAQGGWANGERMFRFIHASPQAWQKFSDLVARGRARSLSEPPVMAHRFDIIPVPERLRGNIAPPSIMEFPADTAIGTLEFNPGDVAARIAPRPLLIMHSAQDEVIAADGSFDLFRCAGYHGDLHIIGGVDHFMFGEDDRRVGDIIANWLRKYFPA
ncbi:MAG: alpha/beta hydrolase [Xanthobacteraceae bacterium]